ncbi:MAG: IPT/TIG domain-containing protein [Tuberibacillus sp.]
MLRNPLRNSVFVLIGLALLFGLSACDSQQTKDQPKKTAETKTPKNQGTKIKNNITLSKNRGTVRQNIDFSIDELPANAPVLLKWTDVTGSYDINGIYEVIGPKFKEKDVVIAKGKSDDTGKWTGTFQIPEGFGGDQTIYVEANGKRIGQTGFKVDPTFTMTPQSGPAGTLITVKVEGLGWSTYNRNWQLTYDNKYTGLVTAIATKGTAEAKFRAAGPVGDHVIRLRTGYLGSPYINYLQSPFPDKPAPEFTFKVTDDKQSVENYVEPIPTAAGGGVKMPKLKNESGVQVTLSKDNGIVGEPISMKASGLPKGKKAEIIWNTMKGSRVSGKGFAEASSKLADATVDDSGQLTYDFNIPEDLGGIPHRIDVKIDNKVYGQAYLRIKPSIASISPSSGPVGTKIQITIKGGGWTEYDNAYYLTYDNAYAGYLCAFNSQGTLVFDVPATGQPGFHIIDLYPGIYKQKQKDTDMTLIPQLTYSTDHPGSSMPAIRLGFTITK